MKIYQVICSGGAYEDFYEYVINTYLHKEKAEEECMRLNNKLKESNRQAEICDACNGSMGCTKKEFDEVECENKQVDEEHSCFDEYWCYNYVDFTCEYYDHETYTVKEYEVIE